VEWGKGTTYFTSERATLSPHSMCRWQQIQDPKHAFYAKKNGQSQKLVTAMKKKIFKSKYSINI